MNVAIFKIMINGNSRIVQTWPAICQAFKRPLGQHLFSQRLPTIKPFLVREANYAFTLNSPPYSILDPVRSDCY